MGRILVVGASLAGLRAAEALRAGGHDGELIVLGAEPHPPYDRPPLSKELLHGAKTREDVMLRQAPGLDVDWQLGRVAAALDLDARAVHTSDGAEIGFDGLVIATGSLPRRLPALEVEYSRVLELRTLDDAVALRAVLERAARVVIVGAGFIGIEVASTAVALGAHVTIASLDPPLAAAGWFAVERATRMLEHAGVDVYVPAAVAGVEDHGDRAVVELHDGTRLDADIVLSAVGVRPATDWLAGSGLDLADGVLCDERLRATGAEGVVAAGDLARWPNVRCGGALMRVEHWSNATGTARAAAESLLHGDDAAPYGDLPLFWSDHFGMRMQSVGRPGEADRFELVAGSADEGPCAVAAYLGPTLVGGLTWAMPRELVALRRSLPDPLVAA